MNKIVTVEQAIKISKELQGQAKRVVLVGGCFDILHIGHVRFLQNAKEQGDVLFVLLESDERIRQLKGEKRPVNNQFDRATVLGALGAVDYIVLLPLLQADAAYDELISALKPAIIATTKGDPGKQHKERQAGLVGGRVVDVIERIDNKSTSLLETKI